MHFFGCSKDSNNKQQAKNETTEQKSSDSNRTDTNNSFSKKAKTVPFESNASVINDKPKSVVPIVSKEKIIIDTIIKNLPEPKEKKDKLPPESNATSPAKSSFADSNQFKSKTKKKAKQEVVKDSKKIDVNASIGVIDPTVKLNKAVERIEQMSVIPSPPLVPHVLSKPKNHKSANQPKYPIQGYYRLHRGLPTPK